MNIIIIITVRKNIMLLNYFIYLFKYKLDRKKYFVVKKNIYKVIEQQNVIAYNSYIHS